MPTIQSVRKYALSDGDIGKIIGDPRVPIFSYPELKHMTSIDEATNGTNCAVLLFPTVSPSIGHWTCLINRPDSIEFFDPYGEAPDTAQKGGMSYSHLQALDIASPYLTKLLRGSGKPVYYNTYPFQKDRGDVATCGRHCAVRLLYAPYSIDKYKRIIDKSKLAPDDFVSGITYDKIKK